MCMGISPTLTALSIGAIFGGRELLTLDHMILPPAPPLLPFDPGSMSSLSLHCSQRCFGTKGAERRELSIISLENLNG